MKKLLRQVVRPVFELQALRYIRRHRLKVVAVVGSLGKTSTKAAIARVLSEKYRVRVHAGNYNDTVSIPMAVFGLDVPAAITSPTAWLRRLLLTEKLIWSQADVDVLVLELGTDKPGEIPHFMSYLKPDIGVLTAVAEEHMEFFKTLDAVAKEECAIADGAKKLLVNTDDVAPEYRDRYLHKERGFIPYGLEAGKGCRFVVHRTADLSGERGDLVIHGETILKDVRLSVLGAPAVRAALAAASVAGLLELTPDEVRRGLMALRPVPGRLQPLPGIKGSLLIDDTYNASPKSGLAGLKLLHRATGRTIAVLGQMNELGDYSREAHEIVGKGASGLDLLITVGPDAGKWLGPAAIEAGLPKDRWEHFDSPFDAGRWLKGQARAGDTILFEGSQDKVFVEEALKYLLSDPAAVAKLVRQSDAWIKKKQEQFKVK